MYPAIRQDRAPLPLPPPRCPFALLLGNVHWARKALCLGVQMFTISDVIGLPTLYCSNASSCTFPGPAHQKWTPALPFFALLLSSSDYPSPLCVLIQYWPSYVSAHQTSISIPLWCICAVLTTSSRPELGGWAFTPFLAFMNDLSSIIVTFWGQEPSLPTLVTALLGKILEVAGLPPFRIFNMYVQVSVENYLPREG